MKTEQKFSRETTGRSMCDDEQEDRSESGEDESLQDHKKLDEEADDWEEIKSRMTRSS